MKTLFIVLFTVLTVGCASGGQFLNTTAGQVAEGNIFSFRDTVINVNPDFKLLKIKDKIKRPGNEIDTGLPDVYQVENIYLFFGVDDHNRVENAAMIKLISLSDNHIRWDHRVDLFRDLKAIQKGKEKIDGTEYRYFIIKILALPEKLFFTLEDEGYRIKDFKCGLSKSYWKVSGNDGGVVFMITYLEGQHYCYGLENGSQKLSTYWQKTIAEFCERLSENIQISHK
jgi:hypothetical protein